MVLRQLQAIFQRFQSQAVGRGIAQINPGLHRWVNYFAIWNCSRCFSYVRDWGAEGAAAPTVGTESSGPRVKEVE